MTKTTKLKITLGAATAILVAIGVGSASQARDKRPIPVPIFLKKADADGNKEFTLNEIQVALSSSFSSADTNGDGALNRSELHHMIDGVRGERKANRKAKRMEKAEGKKPRKKRRIKNISAKRLDKAFTTYDSDANGSIELAELSNHADAFFANVDANGDGKLVRNEFRALKRKK